MIEAKILNKNDVKIYKGNDILSGVFDFNIKSDGSKEEVYELLSEKPWAVIKKDRTHTITIKQYSMAYVPDEVENFILTFKTENRILKFIDCITKSVETVVDKSKKLVTTSVIVSGGVE